MTKSSLATNELTLDLSGDPTAVRVPISIYRSNIKLGDDVTIHVDGSAVSGLLYGAKDHEFFIVSLSPDSRNKFKLDQETDVILFSGREVYSFNAKVLAIDELLGAVILSFPATAMAYAVRKSSRVAIDLDGSITVRSLTEAFDPVSCKVLNLSLGGALIEVDKPKLNSGTVLKLKLIFEDKTDAEVVAIIRHSTPCTIAKDSFIYGVEFIWVGDHETRKIQELIFKVTHES